MVILIVKTVLSTRKIEESSLSELRESIINQENDEAWNKLQQVIDICKSSSLELAISVPTDCDGCIDWQIFVLSSLDDKDKYIYLQE